MTIIFISMFFYLISVVKTSAKLLNNKHYSKNTNIPQLFNVKSERQKLYKNALYNHENSLVLCNGPT